MLLRPSVFCPIDFSDACRGALRYAAAIAEHFYASLVVLSVDELVSAAGLIPFDGSYGGLTKADVDAFVRSTFPNGTPAVAELEIVVTAGKPAVEILRATRERQSDLIVMSTHGLTGIGKALFGSTTERVLRETTIPVLVTPAADPGPASLELLKTSLRRILVPVDLSDATARQVRIARGLAEAFDASMVLMHVVPRPAVRARQRELLPRLFAQQHESATTALNQLRTELPPRLHPQVVVCDGDAPEEIARAVTEHDASLIVMGLHSVVGLSPRMGSVTYRVLCRIARPVVALPPTAERRPLSSNELVTERSLANARA